MRDWTGQFVINTGHKNPRPAGLCHGTKNYIKKIYINEFPSIKMGLFNAEFDSASNDDTSIHGKTIGKNFT